MQQKIEFRKDRDFSLVLGDAIKFVRQNFKSLFGSIIFITGPFILMTGVAYGYMQSTMLSQNPLLGSTRGGFRSMASMYESTYTATYFLAIAVLIICGILVNVLLNSVVYNYMGLYNEKPFGEKITIAEVGARVWSSLGRMIGSMLLLSLVMGVIGLVVVLIFAGIISVTGVVGGILIGLLVFFALLLFMPVLVYFIPAAFYVVVRDGNFIFPALGKVKRYLSGSFWWTWLIMVVALIAIGILQTLFSLPATIMVFSQTFTRMQHLTDGSAMAETSPSILLIVFYTIAMFLTTCTSSILNLICAFNFLGHEEKHEGKGILSRMDEIK